MSFDHILNKLAEKHILAGNKDFAYRLVEASEKECSHCGDKSAELMKRKSKHFCPKCSKQTKCALKGCEAKMMYAEMHKQGEKAYCSKDCAKADKMKKTALDDMIEKYAKTKEEYEGYYGGAKCEKCEDNKASGECENCGKLMCKDCKGSEGKCKGCSRKKTSSLEVLLNKYAGIEDLKKWQAEHGKGKKSSVCPDCGKKKCTCSSMTACAGSMCKAKMQKRHMHMAGGDHYCCAECASEHMGKKAYASDHSEHYHSAIEKIDGHVETMGGDSNNPIFVFDSKEALDEAQGIVPVFLGREVMNKDGKHMLKVTGPKKEAFVNAGDLLRRYSMDLHDTRMEQYPEYRYQAPGWLQDEFGEWLNDYHGSLHPDDDSDLLWNKFMLEKFGENEKYAKTNKKAFVNAGDLLRRYAEGSQDLGPFSGDPEMVGYRREQEQKQMGYQPTEQEEEEYYRARNTSGNTENPWDFGSNEAGIWDQGYDAGYRDALQGSDDSYPMSYNPEDRGLY